MNTFQKPIGAETSEGQLGGVVDIHAHIVVSEYLAFMAETEAGKVSDYLALSAKSGARRKVTEGRLAPSAAGDDEAATALRLQLMDAAGVRVQVLTPTLAPYFADEALSVRTAEILNDSLTGLVRKHSGRLAAFASLPLPHVEASVREIGRALDLGMAGVTLQSFCLGRSMADDIFHPLFREMNARGAILCLQPTVNGLQSPFITEWGLAASAGPLLEDVTVAMHLMVKGIPVLYPDIKIVLPHLGAGLAGMLERLDTQMPKFVPGMKGKPSELARRFWYDTVSYNSGSALRSAVEAFGADRLVPGSDFPELMASQDYADTFRYVQNAGLSQEDSDRVLYDNAPQLLKI